MASKPQGVPPIDTVSGTTRSSAGRKRMSSTSRRMRSATRIASLSLALLLSGCVYVDWDRGGGGYYRRPPPGYYGDGYRRGGPYRGW